MSIFIALGTNLGDKKKNLAQAISLISRQCQVTTISPHYLTLPEGFAQQPDFLNVVIEISTNLAPSELLSFLQTIEKEMGRTKTFLNGPRLIDLDILFYQNKIIHQKDLTIPHPRLHQRLFVLQPLCEIAPNFIHPTLKKSIRDILLSHSG
jgi:2-amino-4-hydroxy-6-hydroxymethyldihydropteridine diphosphokinase